MATIRDVSKLAGVSVATVSRVINKKGYVKDITRTKVLNAMKALDYIPNNMARGLAGMKTQTIALLVSDILNPFFPEIARSIERQASSYDYLVILCHSENNPVKEKEYLKILMNQQVDGVIIASNTITADQIVEIQKQGMPVVVLDRAFNGHPILSLICENKQGSQMAVRHLFEQGCKVVGHISGPIDAYTAMERAIGYEQVCREKKSFLPNLIEAGDFHIDGGYRALNKLIKNHPDIDGVFAGNDLMAIGAIKALKDLNKGVPKDVKVIGFDDISLSKVFMPEISTIKQPMNEMARQSMTYLLDQINKKAVDKKVIKIEVELIKRESTSNK